MPINNIHPKFCRLLATVILLLAEQSLRAETIKVPLQADFPLLRQLLVDQLFNRDTLSTELLHDPSGCSEIVLSDPQLSETDRHLRIDSRLHARLAINMLNRCMPLMTWDGYARVISDPVIKADNPRLVYLQVIDSHLLSTDNEILTSGPLWDRAREHIHPLFNRFRLDLSSSLDELQRFIPLFLPKHSQEQIQAMLSSLQLSDIQVMADGIHGDLSLTIDTVALPERPERPLTEQEQVLWQQKWQSMDALLTHAIKHYAAATELAELRHALFDILLEARYRLVTALAQEQGEDPVRHWFIRSWAQLIPVLHQISAENPRHATLGLLTLITASDALQTLDKLGPAFGLDISMDGLRRLARLLNETPGIDPLQYDETLDPELMRLFQFPPVHDDNDSHYRIDFWPVREALAAVDRPLADWIAKPGELQPYLNKIRKLLLANAERELREAELTGAQQDVFRKLVMTTAWQESCWRQYVVENDKIVPLRSGTGDTGIMQVNERVWRGFVDLHKLRWEVAYNIQSGSRILLNYLTRYALKQGEHKHRGGLDNLARASYSAYNGGPGQVRRYRSDKAPKAQRIIDQSFHKKYQSVKHGEELAVAECLGGKGAHLLLAQERKKTASPSPKPPPPGKGKQLIHRESWIKRQNKNHFTLQLAVFSSYKAAKSFISQQKIPGNYAIYRQPGKARYAIIYGRYSNRQKAGKEGRLFKSSNPWIRRIGDIQVALE